MLVEASKNLRGRHGGSGITLANPKLDDLEAIVHACSKQIVFAGFVWMPFYSPNSSASFHSSDGHCWLADVDESDRFVIAEIGIN